MFIVCEEGIRNPDLLGKVSCQRHTITVVLREGQSLVLPVLIQVYGDSVILQDEKKINLIN